MAKEQTNFLDRFMKMDFPPYGAWWKLSKSQWLSVLKNTAKDVGKNNVLLLGSAVALSIVMSFVPSLIAFIAIGSIFIGTEDIQGIAIKLSEVLPDVSQELIVDRINQAVDSLASGGVGIVAILGGLWSASGAASALVASLNQIAKVEESRHFVKTKLVAFGVVIGLGLTLVAIILVLFIHPILDAVMPQIIDLNQSFWASVTGNISIIALILFLLIFFAFLYAFAPNVRRPFRILTPGAVFAVLSWVVVSLGLRFVISTFTQFSATYGALAGVFVGLIWLRLAMSILLIGATLNEKVLIAIASSHPDVDPKVDAIEEQGQIVDKAND